MKNAPLEEQPRPPYSLATAEDAVYAPESLLNHLQYPPRPEKPAQQADTVTEPPPPSHE